MAGCKVVNQGLVDAKSSIDTIASEYDSAGSTLLSSLESALSDMQGAAKDALFESFINKTLKPFVTGMEEGAQSLPAAIKGMGSLLEANRTNFVDVDQQIATSIAGG